MLTARRPSCFLSSFLNARHVKFSLLKRPSIAANRVVTVSVGRRRAVPLRFLTKETDSRCVVWHSDERRGAHGACAMLDGKVWALSLLRFAEQLSGIGRFLP
jgi:hypothetical protein